MAKYSIIFNEINSNLGGRKVKNLLLGDAIINQFIQVIPITLLIGIFYIIFRIAYLKKQKIKINFKEEILYLIFVCYIVGLINLILVPSNFWSQIWYFIFHGVSNNPLAGMFDFEYNFIPTLYKIIKGEYILGSWVKTMIIGNVFMFIPLGILLPLCIKRINHKNFFLYAFLIPLIIEILQPFIGRSFDIDDIIMNFLGIIIGYLILVCIRKILKLKNKH